MAPHFLRRPPARAEGAGATNPPPAWALFPTTCSARPLSKTWRQQSDCGRFRGYQACAFTVWPSAQDRDAVAVGRSNVRSARSQRSSSSGAPREDSARAALGSASAPTVFTGIRGTMASVRARACRGQSQLFLADRPAAPREGISLRGLELVGMHAMRLVHRDGMRLFPWPGAPCGRRTRLPPALQHRLADQDARYVSSLFDPEHGRHDVSGSDLPLRRRPCVELHNSFTRVHCDLYPPAIASRIASAAPDHALRVVAVRQQRAGNSSSQHNQMFWNSAAEALDSVPHPRDLRRTAARAPLDHGCRRVLSNRRIGKEVVTTFAPRRGA